MTPMESYQSLRFGIPLDAFGISRGDLGAPVNEVTIQGELEWVEITRINIKNMSKEVPFIP